MTTTVLDEQAYTNFANSMAKTGITDPTALAAEALKHGLTFPSPLPAAWSTDTANGAFTTLTVTGTATVGALVQTNNIRRRTDGAPTSSTGTGALGDFVVTADYAYFCIATNSWVRIATDSSTW